MLLRHVCDVWISYTCTHTTNAYQSFQSLSNQYIISQNVKLSHFLYVQGAILQKCISNAKCNLFLVIILLWQMNMNPQNMPIYSFVNTVSVLNSLYN